MMAPPILDSSLTYSLAARESYFAGEPVVITFKLENDSDETLYVLKWYTPLEGLGGNVFKVTRDGEEIPYNGPMVKRGDPQGSDYAELRPRSSVSAEVDLSPAYDLSKPGNYQVEFAGKIYDVTSNKSTLPRIREKHQGKTVSGNSLSFRITHR